MSVFEDAYGIEDDGDVSDNDSNLGDIADDDSGSDISNDERPILDNPEYLYPALNTSIRDINPDTRKRYTQKEINEKLRAHIESRWQNNPIPHEGFIFKGHSPGPVGFEETPLAVYERFLTDDLVEIIVNCSNDFLQTERYITKLKPKRKAGSWCAEVTSNDIRLWFGVNILLAIHNKPNLQDNWSRDEYLSTPIFKEFIFSHFEH